MEDAWRGALLAVGVASAIPVGVMALLVGVEGRVRGALPYLVAFGAGALVGAAAFHLIPEALTRTGQPGLVAALVVGGYAAFLLAERWLHGRAGGEPCDDPAQDASPGALGAAPPRAVRRALVVSNLVGDGLHNLIDGMLIGASFLADPSVGVLTAVAVSLHELPREVGTFCVFVHAGVPARTALAFTVVSGSVAVIGTMLTLATGARVQAFATALLPFAAGSFVYIAGTVLRPAFRRSGPARALAARAAALVLGVLLTGASALAL